MTNLADLLVAIGIDTSDMTDGADDAAGDVENSLRGIAGAAAGAAVGAAFAVGLSSAMDMASATTRLQNQLDLTGPQAERAGDVAGDVFAAGFGESVDEVGGALRGVVANVGELGDFTDGELQGMTKSALALADTFEFDVAESTQAVGTLMKAGLAKDGTEAFDLLTAAAQKLPPSMASELPALTTEYSEFFDQLGFTGPQMFGLLAQAAQDPTFELDKLGDAMKEFTLQLADTDKVREPLQDLGLDVEHIQGLVNEGKGTKAFDEVVSALKGVEDQTERTTLQAALFGGPGEDMGNSLLSLSTGGAAAATGMDQAAGSAKGVTEAMEGSPAQQFSAIMRQLSGILGELLGPALAEVGAFMQENPSLVRALAAAFLILAIGLGIAAVAQWAMNAAMFANPITWIILLIVALIAIVILIIAKWDFFKKKLLSAWSAIQGGLGDGWDWMVDNVFAPIGRFFTDTIPGWVGQGVDWVKAKWNGLVGWVTGLPGRISAAAAGMWDGLTAAFRSAVNWLIGKWNSFSLTIGGGSVLGVDIPSVTLNTPNIPYLAEGGVATGPTLAMIGEGRENEAVLPLSKLDSMLRGVNTAVGRTGDTRETRLVLDVRNGTDDLVRLVQKWVRTTGRGRLESLAGK